MSDFLQDAEARGHTAQADRQAFEAAVVASMREEIGPQNYHEGKEQLPIVEQVLMETRVWLEQLATIERTSGASLRLFQDILQSISRECDAGTQQIRRGIAAYEQLTFRDIAWAKDPRQVDLTQRAFLIGRIRQDLRNFDGKVSFLKSQQSRVESAIQQSGWPQHVGVAVAMATIAPKPAPAREIPVEVGGGPKPPI